MTGAHLRRNMTVFGFLSVAPVREGSMAAEVAKAVEADRVSTFLKVDDKRAVRQAADEKVSAVEDHLGYAARSDRDDG